MNVKRYYRQYNELITKHQRISYKIVLDALEGIFSDASKLYSENPLIPIELMVKEQDTLDFLVKIYNGVGIETAVFVDSSLPKQKSSALIIQTKASGKPKQLYKIDNSDKINYWKQEFILFTQSPDCARKVSKITETTKEQIRQVMNAAVKEQLSHKEIAKLLLDQGGEINTKKRALLIARTENCIGSNRGSITAAKSSGLVLYKQWIARSGDGKTRDSHAGMVDSAPIPMDQPFDVGDEKMLHPGDSSKGATAKNICNCRCTVAFIPASEVIQQGLNNPEPTKPVVNYNPIQPVIQPPKKGFIPAKNLLEAEKFITDNDYSENVDYIWCKDIEVVNTINEALFTVRERYPFNSLKNVGLNTTNKNAMMSANYNTLNVNHSSFSTIRKAKNLHNNAVTNFQDSIEKNIEIVKYNLEHSKDYKSKRHWSKVLDDLYDRQNYNRFTVSYGEDTIIRDSTFHELAHVLHDQRSGMINGVIGINKRMIDGNGRINDLAQDLNKELEDIYQKALANKDIYKISVYAKTNKREFFCESFVMHMNADSSLPSYIGEFIERYLTVTK